MAVSEQRAPRERSAIRNLHCADPDGPERRVYVDCQLTRRKRHHMVTDRADAVLFRSRWFSDIVEWLAAEGITSYEIVTDRARHVVTVSDDSQHKGN